MDVDRIIESFDMLTLAELRQVESAVKEWIALTEERQRPDEERYPEPHRTLVQEYVRCGKERCKKCSEGGPGHGPYWYAYSTIGGRRRKRYLGKERPPT